MGWRSSAGYLRPADYHCPRRRRLRVQSTARTPPAVPLPISVTPSLIQVCPGTGTGPEVVPDLPGGGDRDRDAPPSPSPISGCPESGSLPGPRFAEIGDRAGVLSVSTPLALKGVTVDSEASPEVWSHNPIIAKLRLVNLNSTVRRRPAMANDVVDYSGTSDKDKVIRSADSPPLRLWHSVAAGSQLQRRDPECQPECTKLRMGPAGGQGRSPVPVPDLSGTPPPPGRGTLRPLSPPRPSPIPIGGSAAPWSKARALRLPVPLRGKRELQPGPQAARAH
jgi:hypothetical protein